MNEVGIVITITLDNEHLVNECFTARSSEADDALAHAIGALEEAQRTCEERAESEWETIMDAKSRKQAISVGGSVPLPEDTSENG